MAFSWKARWTDLFRYGYVWNIQCLYYGARLFDFGRDLRGDEAIARDGADDCGGSR